MASVTKRGDGYLAQVRIKKHGVIIFSESKTFATEALAGSWAGRLEGQLKTKGIGAVARGRMTVGELILKHLEYIRSLRQIGRSAIANAEYMASVFAAVNLNDLKSSQVAQFAARRRAEGLTPATILANLSALSAAVHAAPHAHGIQVDPAPVDEAIKRLKDSGVIGRSREVIRLLDPDEEKALLEEFARRNHHHQTTFDMTLIMRFALAFPRRAGELMRITWNDVDRRHRTVTIRDVKHPTKKQGNDQVVPLLGQAWEILQAAPVLGEQIFPHKTESVLSAFERVRNRIADSGMPGIRDFRFHDLRHEGITRLFQLGLSIQEVALVSGHTNWAQLRRYSHLRPIDVHKRFDELSGKSGDATMKHGAVRPHADELLAQ